MKNESPDEAFLNHPAYQVGIQLDFDKIEETDHLVGEKRKRDDEEGPPPKKHKGVDTSFAVNLTEPDKLTTCVREKRGLESKNEGKRVEVSPGGKGGPQ